MKTIYHFCIAIFLVALVVVLTFTCGVRAEAAIVMITLTAPSYLLGFLLLRFLLTREVRVERWGGIVHTKRVWRWK